MKAELQVAQELTAQVMGQAESILRPYAVDYADIDFGFTPVKLGEGSFGTVFKARYRGEHDVAVKTMRVSKVTEEELEKFKSELIVMAPLHHENLVRLWGGVWSEGADKLCIVLEYCPGGSLKTFLNTVTETWQDLRHGLALGAAKGLRYLHHDLSEPLIHRDVKPDNILVVERCAKASCAAQSLLASLFARVATTTTQCKESSVLALTPPLLYATVGRLWREQELRQKRGSAQQLGVQRCGHDDDGRHDAVLQVMALLRAVHVAIVLTDAGNSELQAHRRSA